MVDILVRPEGGLVDNPGFPCGGVVPLKGPGGFRVEVPGDLAKLLRPFLLRPLHPLSGFIVFAILVYFLDRLEGVLLFAKPLHEESYSFHVSPLGCK